MLTAPQGGVLPQGGRRWPPPEQSRPHLPSPPGACSAALPERQLGADTATLTQTLSAWSSSSSPFFLAMLRSVFFFPQVCRPSCYFQKQISWRLQWKSALSSDTGNCDREDRPDTGRREARGPSVPRSLGPRPPLGGGPRGYPSHLRRFQAVVCVAGKWGRRQERKMIPWPFPCGPRLLAMFAHPGPPHIIHPSGSLSRTRRHGIVVATSAGRTWGTELQLLTVVCYN